jgi:formylglycine-generating enzyme required for sulfatase activity
MSLIGATTIQAPPVPNRPHFYQWKKNGIDLLGETCATLTLADANATLHGGNYTLVVSNDFGSVHTQSLVLDINETALYHTVSSVSNLEIIWVPPGPFTMGSPTTESGRASDETQYPVTLTNGFHLGKYEVNQAQYQAVMTGSADSLSATPSQ